MVVPAGSYIVASPGQMGPDEAWTKTAIAMAVLDSLTTIFTSNPIFVGGAGTLVVGSLMYLLRAVPVKLWDAANKVLWTTVFVESQSNDYRDVDAYIETLRLDVFSRSLEMKDGSLKTGFGSGWGRYNGTLFRYVKSKSPQQLAPLETITLSFLTRDRGVVDRFMRDCRPAEHRNSITVSAFGPAGNAGGLRRKKRGLDTVFVDDAIKQRLVDRLHWFETAEAWHASRGIPWKLGIILYGPPGTGKTSLIHALASDFSLNIKYIKSLHGIGSAFLTGTKSDLFVIEDIDALAAGLNREAANGIDFGAGGDAHLRGSPLHEILNAMDGMQTPDGLKFIVTTNHIGKLDPAIVRPGRIDEVIEVGPLSLESARAMFKAFYGREGILAYSPRTGAELQRMFSTLSPEAAEAELALLAAHPPIRVVSTAAH